MKIYKSEYGWSTTAHSHTTSGQNVKCYLDVQFKKGHEPKEEMEGDLIFRDKFGTERPCFFSSYAKQDGTVKPKLVVLEPGMNKPVQTSLTGSDRTVDGHLDPEINISPEELPFINL